MRRVLMVAYYFPPIGGIGSIRAASFAKYLPEFGWEATVLAPVDTPHLADPSLDTGAVKVARARSLEFTRLQRQSTVPGGNVSTAAPHQPVVRSPLARRLRRMAKPAVFPDPQIGWFPAATARGARLLREGDFDLIFSSAFPITSHLIAAALKRASAMPWVAESRDPWSDDPTFRLIAAPARRLERVIAASADAMVMPTHAWAEYYAPRWGIDVAVIGHGSDTEFQCPVSRPESAVLAHVGTYIPGRQSLETLWSALAEMRRRGLAIPRLLCAGAFPGEARAEVVRHGLGDMLDLHGFVSQPEALSLISSASALISCDFVDAGPLSLGWVPAKLPEYLASGTPIIHVGHPTSEAARMLRRYPGCYIVPFGDIQGAIRAVQSAMDGEIHLRDVSGLSRKARTAELAALFETVVRRRDE